MDSMRRHIPPAYGVNSGCERSRQKSDQRLGGDREQRYSTRGQHDSTSIDTQATFESVRMLAHRVRKTTAFHEDAAIRDAANALGQAFLDAIHKQALIGDPRVYRMIRSLSEMLSTTIADTAP